MTLALQILVLVWGISAAVCFEAYAETRTKEKWQWRSILIWSLLPVVNTLIALHYLRDKLSRN